MKTMSEQFLLLLDVLLDPFHISRIHFSHISTLQVFPPQVRAAAQLLSLIHSTFRAEHYQTEEKENLRGL